MLESYRLVHYLRFFFAGSFVLWVFVHFVADREHSRYAGLFRQFRSEKDVFVDEFLRNDVEGAAFNGTGISDLCASKKWTKGLVLTCEAVPGGVADVKNGVLNCIRIAIEMGAEVIVPDIVLRSVIDLSVVVPNDVGPLRGVPLDHFFDRTHLNQSLARYCPQMRVHNSLDDFANEPTMLTPAKLDVFLLPKVTFTPVAGSSDSDTDRAGRGDRGHLLAQPAQLGAHIHAYLDKTSPPSTRRYPYRVHLRPTPAYLFPATQDQRTLHDNFGRLVRVRPDARRLAASALFNLQKAFNVTLDPRTGLALVGAGASAAGAPVPVPGSFVGVELRTQPDPRPFPPYTVQASDALSYVVANNASRVYLARGATAADATAFAARARDFGIAVVTAADLLEGGDAAALAALSYDEHGLVDYEILLRAGLFTGQAGSSFAWNLALRRQHAYGTPGAPGASGADASHLNGTIRWHDRYSTLYGKAELGEHLHLSIWP